MSAKGTHQRPGDIGHVRVALRDLGFPEMVYRCGIINQRIGSDKRLITHPNANAIYSADPSVQAQLASRLGHVFEGRVLGMAFHESKLHPGEKSLDIELRV